MSKVIKSNRGVDILVDDVDFDVLNQYLWHIDSNGYPASCGVRMHTLITQEKEVDHKNNNKQDNQRHNLRPCTRSQNMANNGLRSTNTTGYKGVHFDVYTQQWKAHITVNGKTKTLGRYANAELAAQRYDSAAKFYFEDFARLNFP